MVLIFGKKENFCSFCDLHFVKGGDILLDAMLAERCCGTTTKRRPGSTIENFPLEEYRAASLIAKT